MFELNNQSTLFDSLQEAQRSNKPFDFEAFMAAAQVQQLAAERMSEWAHEWMSKWVKEWNKTLN